MKSSENRPMNETISKKPPIFLIFNCLSTGKNKYIVIELSIPAIPILTVHFNSDNNILWPCEVCYEDFYRLNMSQ